MFTLEGLDDAICCLAYAPNGQVLATGDQGGWFNSWELSRRRSRKSFYLPGAYANLFADRMTSISYSPDGNYLVTTTDTFPPFPRVWRASDMTLLREWEGGFSTHQAVFTPDGRTVVSAGSGDEDDCPLYLWDFTQTEGVPGGRVEDVELNGTSRTPQEPVVVGPGHDRDVLALACSPQGVVVTGSADHTARIWDVGARAQLASRSFRGWVRSVAISPDGRLAALCSGRTVYLWDLANPSARPRFLAGHTKTVRTVAFHPRGRVLASGGDDGVVRLWDVEGGTTLQAFDWNLGWIGALAFAPDGDTAAAGGGNGRVVVFDLD